MFATCSLRSVVPTGLVTLWLPHLGDPTRFRSATQRRLCEREMRMQTRHCAGHREAVHPTPTSRVAPLAASAHNAACRQSRRHQVQHRGTGVAWLPGIAVRRSSACRVASAATGRPPPTLGLQTPYYARTQWRTS